MGRLPRAPVGRCFKDKVVATLGSGLGSESSVGDSPSRVEVASPLSSPRNRGRGASPEWKADGSWSIGAKHGTGPLA